MVQGKQKPINKVRSLAIKQHLPTANFLLQLAFISNKNPIKNDNI